MAKKFISFNLPKDEEKELFKEIKEKAVKTSAALIKRAQSLQENTDEAKDLNSLKRDVLEDLSAIQALVDGYLVLLSSTEKENEKNPRKLDNGGLAPPVNKTWKDVNLTYKEEQGILDEIRKLNNQGVNLNPSKFFHKTPVNIEEFTYPFSYLEKTHDYNGGFLVTVLKSEHEIQNTASKLKIDLSSELKSCTLGEKLILAIYDITGSPSKSEEKFFVIILNFNPFNGVLVYENVKGLPTMNLSNRQIQEIKNFCSKKKITTNL